MEVGLFFGSFNPIHIGHLIIANFILNNNYVNEIWFIVSPQNPLKKQSILLNEYHRLHLVKISINDQPNLKVNDVEFRLSRPSYTIDTLSYLKEKYFNIQFKIIVGSDNLENIHKWKNSEKLIADNQFIVYERADYLTKMPNSNFNEMKAPMINISSSYIRNMIKEKKSIRYLVTDNVYKEINEFGYYR